MLVLTLDSSATASVALARIDSGTARAEILASRTSEDTRSHTEVLAPYTTQVLEQAGADGSTVDAIITGTGPGPFTGLRAGIMMARALGLAWNKPVYGLMSLTAIAERVFSNPQGFETNAEGKFLVATDARRREIYSAVFAAENNTITNGCSGYRLVAAPTVGPASQAPALPAYGYGAGLYAEQLAAIGANAVPGYTNIHPTASDLAQAAVRIGIKNLSRNTQALYLRESDAKIPAAMKGRATTHPPRHSTEKQEPSWNKP